MDGNDVIPKILHFIWFGELEPEYVGFAIRAFHQINPDYQIMFTKRTTDDLLSIWNGRVENQQDAVIKRSMERIFCQEPDSYVREQQKLYGKNIRFIQILSDVVRVELLNQFGGLYLDCDTFPIKPFPEEFNQYEFIICKRKSGSGFILDNYFMGKKKNQMCIVDPFDVPNSYYLQHPPLNSLSPRFIINRKKFFDCSLTIGSYSFDEKMIFDHYVNESWKKTPYKIPQSKLDELLWKK